MRNLIYAFFLFVTIGLSIWPFTLSAQNGIRAFGLQFKPIIPLGLVNTNGQTVIDQNNNTTLDITDNGGFSVGAVIRMGLSNRFSFETGINYIRRNYSFDLNSPDFKASKGSLRLTGYELPALGMVFVKLGEQMFMNASAGFVLDLFPTGGLTDYDRDTIEYGMLETNWMVPAFNVNLGFEYRTIKNGYFYIGASYHRPFSSIADVYISYIIPGTVEYVPLVQPSPSISGSYLTLDLRYFFNPGMKEKRTVE